MSCSFNSKITWIPGDWISVSIMPMRRPSAASKTAMLAVMFDLPVPPRNEWSEMILLMASLHGWIKCYSVAYPVYNQFGKTMRGLIYRLEHHSRELNA